MRRTVRGLRSTRPANIVRVYTSVDGKPGAFLRYETPQGVPCDERGVPLGVVTFKRKGGKG